MEIHDLSSELYLLIPLGIGALLLLISTLWFYYNAFSAGFFWGLLALVFAPLFWIFKWRLSRGPILLSILGFFIIGVPLAVYHFVLSKIDKEPIVTTRNTGERVLTITGAWSSKDYHNLVNYPDVEELQMANPDVTDETLEYLRDMPKLSKLDLGHTKVTDEGMRVLATLTNLTELHLPHTSITSQGFEHLSKLENLKSINLQGTTVGRDVLEPWKQAKPDRKYMAGRKPSMKPTPNSRKEMQP